jgi:hypothetical protein
VVDVPDRPYVHVRLRPIEFRLGHPWLASLVLPPFALSCSLVRRDGAHVRD